MRARRSHLCERCGARVEGHGSHGRLHDRHVKAVRERVERRRAHAVVCRNAANNDVLDAARLEATLQWGEGPGSTLTSAAASPSLAHTLRMDVSYALGYAPGADIPSPKPE